MPSKEPPSTAPHRLYAHWLDGEWLKIAYPIAAEGRYLTLPMIAEGALKLHALFGTRIVISDVQLTDSEAVVRLFADPEFREYLKTDPDFMTLVADPPPGTEDSNFSRAIRGIHRASGQGWTTSLPGISVDLIKRFGEAILSVNSLNAGCLRDQTKGPGKVIATSQPHQTLLLGMFYGMSHFAKKTGGPSENPIAQPRPYTDFIHDVLHSKGLEPDVFGALEGIWKSVETTLVPDESKRRARTALLRALESREPNRQKWTPEWHTIWNTAVHAWNSNVCDTVGASGASIAPLPHAVIAFRGAIVDVVAPFQEKGGLLRPKDIGRYPVFKAHPNDFSWLNIRDAIRKVRAKRKEFQTALQSGDPGEIKETSLQLVNKLEEALVLHRKTVLPEWMWVPASLAALILHIPSIHAAEAGDKIQAFLRGTAKRNAVLNTLHGFRLDLISGFTS